MLANMSYTGGNPPGLILDAEHDDGTQTLQEIRESVDVLLNFEGECGTHHAARQEDFTKLPADDDKKALDGVAAPCL